MPDEAYTSATRGALKLKGSSGPAGIKKKKKKPKASVEASDPKASALQKALEEEDASTELALKDKGKEKAAEAEDIDEEEEARLRELDPRGQDGKTASERAREDMRRKRLNERLQKEGVKTHKQRVEELNKYLSNLSEHHDMPRIGPG